MSYKQALGPVVEMNRILRQAGDSRAEDWPGAGGGAELKPVGMS